MNIEYEVTLANKLWLLTQQQIEIRRITLSLRIKGLNSTIHDIDEYILILIYISASRKDDIEILYRIFREIYLVSDLKAHLLIDNNIIDLKRIVFNIV